MNLLLRMSSMAWALERTVLDNLAQVLARHDEGVKLSPDQISAAIGRPAGDAMIETGYQVQDGVAIIPITGVIARYASQVNDVSQPSGTSTEAILQDLRRALADPKVSAILLAFDSPGGSVSGVAETAAIIAEANTVKPVIALADDMMASAAYWLGAGAGEIYATPSALVGSNGVYTVSVDSSKAAENRGVKYEVIGSGPYKGAGVPGTPVTDAHKAASKSVVDHLASLFFAHISEQRDLTGQALTDVTDGRVHVGEAAQKLGLVDGISTRDQLVQNLAARRFQQPARRAAAALPTSAPTGADSTTSTTEASMSTPAPAAPAAAAQTAAPAAPATPAPAAAAPAKPVETVAASSEKAAIDRLTALEAAFPGEEKFALEQFKAGHTVDQAKACYADVLKARLTAETKRANDLDAENKTLKQAADGKVVGTRALPTEKPKSEEAKAVEKDARIVAWEAKLVELKKAGHQLPMRAAVEQFPELHQAYVEACNGQ